MIVYLSRIAIDWMIFYPNYCHMIDYTCFIFFEKMIDYTLNQNTSRELYKMIKTIVYQS